MKIRRRIVVDVGSTDTKATTRHAQHKPMRRELGIRLAPIISGDGSLEKAT